MKNPVTMETKIINIQHKIISHIEKLKEHDDVGLEKVAIRHVDSDMVVPHRGAINELGGLRHHGRNALTLRGPEPHIRALSSHGNVRSVLARRRPGARPSGLRLGVSQRAALLFRGLGGGLRGGGVAIVAVAVSIAAVAVAASASVVVGVARGSHA